MKSELYMHMHSNTDLNAWDNLRWTALHLACWYGGDEIVKEISKQWANPNPNALIKIFKELLERGADISELLGLKIVINTREDYKLYEMDESIFNRRMFNLRKLAHTYNPSWKNYLHCLWAALKKGESLISLSQELVKSRKEFESTVMNLLEENSDDSEKKLMRYSKKIIAPIELKRKSISKTKIPQMMRIRIPIHHSALLIFLIFSIEFLKVLKILRRVSLSVLNQF